MARKTATANESHHGFNDIIGIVLMVLAVLLLAAVLSFDPSDLATHRNPPNRPEHNWIGPLGARMAEGAFFLFGITGYTLPVLLAFVGLGCFFQSLAYLRRRWPWAAVLLLSCMGLLHLADVNHLRDPGAFLTRAREAISAPCLGGFFGMSFYDFGFKLLGRVGAGIIYVALDLISLLFLTNFQLGQWIRGIWPRRPAAGKGGAEELALEKRARELQKQKKQLEEEVARSGLGADLKPV